MTYDAMPMDEIDAVLTDWYEWSQAYRPVAGYNGSDSSCSNFQISRQWMDYEDLSELVDFQLSAVTGNAVEPIVLALGMRHRIAVTTAVRNFAAGALVFANPRNPETQESDYAQAKAIMRPALVEKGLIKYL